MLKPLPYKIGEYRLNATNALQGGKPGDIPLGMPLFLQSGVGILVGMEVECQCTIASHASDPAVKGYLLDQLIDDKLEAPIGMELHNALGWHKAVREAMQTGRVKGPYPVDIPATGSGGAGSYTRTIYKRFNFQEPFLREKNGFVFPTAFWSKWGHLRLTPYTTDQSIGGANLKLTDLTVIVRAYIVDVDPKAVPIGAIRQQGFTGGVSVLSEATNTPGKMQFLRCLAVLSPNTDTVFDDLTGINKISFGVQGSYTQFERDVDELLKQYNAEFNRDPEHYYDTDPGTRKEEFRFLDPFSNVSGKERAIPVVYLHRGHSMMDAPDFRKAVQNPTLRINDNINLSGLDFDTIDYLWDVIASRPDGFAEKVFHSVNENKPFPGEAALVHPVFKGKGFDPARVPLLANLSI